MTTPSRTPPASLRAALRDHDLVALDSAAAGPPELRSRVWQSVRDLLSGSGDVTRAPSRGRGHTDGAILDALRQRERWAADALYQRFAGPLHCYALRHLDAADASSAVHDAFVKVAAKGPELEPGSNLKALLYHLTRAEVVDALRRQLRRREEPRDDLDDAADLADPLAPIIQRAALGEAARALDACCSPLEQDVIVLTVEGRSSAEIAGALELREDHVRTLRSRARGKLAAWLRRAEVA